MTSIRSRKTQQLLNMGRTTAKLGPIAKVGRALERFILVLTLDWNGETAIKSEGDELGRRQRVWFLVPQDGAARSTIIVNKAFPTSSIRVI